MLGFGVLKLPHLLMAGIAFALAGAVPIGGQQQLCNARLDAQSAVAACDEWKQCGDQNFTQCCAHAHKALNWKACVLGSALTGKICGTPVEKRYNLIEQYCVLEEGEMTCGQSGPAGDCPDHYEDHFSLADCPDPPE